MRLGVKLAVHPRVCGRPGVPAVLARSGVPAAQAVAAAVAPFVVRKST